MICPVVQCLHEQSPCVSPMFVCCSGDLVVHLLQGGGRGRNSSSDVISCSQSKIINYIIIEMQFVVPYILISST